MSISYIMNPEKTYENVQSILQRYAGGRTGTEGYPERREPPRYHPEHRPHHPHDYDQGYYRQY